MAAVDEAIPRTMKTRRWRKRILRGFILFLVLFVAFIGPWPGGNATYVGSDDQLRTLERLEAMQLAPAPRTTLRVGVVERDITPDHAPSLDPQRTNYQLAGYAARSAKYAEGVFKPVFARALTIEASGRLVTILTVDLLTMHPRLARAVLERTGLNPDDVYFTASHTHSGPGQWADAWYEEFAVGEYSDTYFQELAEKLAIIVKSSRKHLVDAEVGVAIAHAPTLLRPRIAGVDHVDHRIVALVFRAPVRDPQHAAPPIAVLVTYAAHATACGRDDARMSPDYPGGLVDRLRELTGASHVLFAAGAVGDAAPTPANGLSCESAEQMGAALADIIAPAIADMAFEREAELANVRLTVDLPVLRLPITSHLRTSPLLTPIFDDRETHVHVLRIGRAVLAGMPCDFSGGAAQPFIEWARANRLVAMPTSFNSDYHGYFMSSEEFFNCQKLEQRATFLRGPWVGEYFSDLAIRIGAHTLGEEPPPRADSTATKP